MASTLVAIKDPLKGPSSTKIGHLRSFVCSFGPTSFYNIRVFLQRLDRRNRIQHVWSSTSFFFIISLPEEGLEETLLSQVKQKLFLCQGRY